MKTFYRWAFVLVAVLTGTLQINAAHILGGQLSYTCLGSNTYKFTLTIYRDCKGSGAPFDSALGAQIPATVTIYQGDDQIPFGIVQLEAPEITDLEFEGECKWSQICIQKGVYEFQLVLPPSSHTWHITYQRCCLSHALMNVVAPNQTGLTFTIALTPEARNVCNSSPVFEGPEFSCSHVNEPVSFPHNATDPDGDSLVYEFCAPYMGGGDNQDYPFAPGGVAPNPDLPPPYLPVAFASPSSSQMPIPGLSLGSLSGLISGTPEITGKYLYAICVSEYRDGQLLSRSQFVMRNVVDLFTATEELLPEKGSLVYPNPASSAIHLNLPLPCESYKIQLSSLDGRYAKHVNCEASQIDVGQLQSGIYFLRIAGEKMSYSEKVVILN